MYYFLFKVNIIYCHMHSNRILFSVISNNAKNHQLSQPEFGRLIKHLIILDLCQTCKTLFMWLVWYERKMKL